VRTRDKFQKFEVISVCAKKLPPTLFTKCPHQSKSLIADFFYGQPLTLTLICKQKYLSLLCFQNSFWIGSNYTKAFYFPTVLHQAPFFSATRHYPESNWCLQM